MDAIYNKDKDSIEGWIKAINNTKESASLSRDQTRPFKTSESDAEDDSEGSRERD